MRIAVLFLSLAAFCSAIPAHAQFTTPQQADKATPVDIPNKAPDMVCFGEGPNWSVQLQQGRARNIGINEPDSFFTGNFVWVPDMKAWNWRGANTNGNGRTLNLTIQKDTCVDSQRKQEFPYKAQAMLPGGAIAFGCCRKLKPGEAAVGPDGYIPPNKQ